MRDTTRSSTPTATATATATQKAARRKWTSAFRVMQSLHRLQNPPTARSERSSDASNGSTPSRECQIDPVYLALKHATCKYERRGSSVHNFDSATPSPRKLSQSSLQDSGYVETSGSRGALVGSITQLDQSAESSGRKRAPKLRTQMKSLSLDCAEPPSHATGNIRSRIKLAPTPMRLNRSGDISDWERSRSPSGFSNLSSRGAPCRVSSSAILHGCHIVIHEYIANSNTALYLGERLRVVDNGDPDWLHGFKIGDRSDNLITFPSTCVAPIRSGEQPMRITQNVHITEARLRLYRDQVVFAQQDSIQNGRVLIRTEHDAMLHCPLQYLVLL
ncbi:hypothetical protein AB6A40_002040 [Gnathostoma spinigerum]|uniref:STAC3-related SH3 domain-containing protein n=1 Tax=Gnathostoma spinigerum TaxID=75299 RepID=A0ABD6E832_9BILA